MTAISRIGFCLCLMLLGACVRAPAVVPASSSGATTVRAIDRAEMALVPAGEFLMGSNAGDLDERPQRRVYLDAFEIDRYEVTNVQYRRFLLATGHEPPRPWPGRYTAFRPEHDPDWHGTEYPDGEALHPVVGVSWADTVAYCAWAGKRLPTEAEWEKAARGTDGRAFPWGDEWDADKANVGETGTGYTQPVGSYPAGASPYGALDMAGNAWEWVADLYGRQYYALAPDHNPPGPATGTGEQILRGGAWDSPPQHVRVAFRNATHCFGPNYRAGFRCARSIGMRPGLDAPRSFGSASGDERSRGAAAFIQCSP